MDEYRFESSELFPNRHRLRAPVAALVFPERDVPFSVNEALSPMKAFERLIGLTSALLTDPSARPCFAVARALAERPSFQLRSGSDALETERATQLLFACY